MIPKFNYRISNEAKDFLLRLSSNLRLKGSPAELQISNKILEYSALISNTDFLQFCINEFATFSLFFSQAHPSIKFNVIFRFKSFKSFMQKLLKNSNESKSLDIKDCIAFRIIIDGTINDCYKISNALAHYLLQDGFILCESRPIKSNLYKGSDITIPFQSLIEPEYANCFKDYIAWPKENGYQGVHLRARDLKFGRFLEIQIRTKNMNNRAELGLANHSEYKQSKYKSVFAEFAEFEYPDELSEAIVVKIQ